MHCSSEHRCDEEPCSAFCDYKRLIHVIVQIAAESKAELETGAGYEAEHRLCWQETFPSFSPLSIFSVDIVLRLRPMLEEPR